MIEIYATVSCEVITLNG